MHEPRLLCCGEERAPCKPWAPPCPPASSEAQSSHPCDLQAGEPSGAFRRADVVHLHPRRPGGGQAVVSRSPHLGKSERRRQAVLWPLVTSPVSVTSALSENGLGLQQSSDC